MNSYFLYFNTLNSKPILSYPQFYTLGLAVESYGITIYIVHLSLMLIVIVVRPPKETYYKINTFRMTK